MLSDDYKVVIGANKRQNIKKINPLTGEYRYNINFHFNIKIVSVISF